MQQNNFLEEKITMLAEVLLTNLPNHININAGFREYNDHLIMLAEKHDAKRVIIPVEYILKFLENKYDCRLDNIDNITNAVGRLLQDIYSETKQKRMLGFDGVCLYLYANMDKNKSFLFERKSSEKEKIKNVILTNRSDDLRYYVQHPLVSQDVREQLTACKKMQQNIISQYNEQVIGAINKESGNKYCPKCQYNLEKCDFKSNFNFYKRRPSYDYNGTFVDLKNNGEEIESSDEEMGNEIGF